MPESKHISVNLVKLSIPYASLGHTIEEKISPYGYYLDITEEQCNLLLQHWNDLVVVIYVFKEFIRYIQQYILSKITI